MLEGLKNSRYVPAEVLQPTPFNYADRDFTVLSPAKLIFDGMSRASL